MARNNMTIVIKVRDEATAQIKSISDALEKLGVISKQVAAKVDTLDKIKAGGPKKKKSQAEQDLQDAKKWNVKNAKFVSMQDAGIVSEKEHYRKANLLSTAKHIKQTESMLVASAKTQNSQESKMWNQRGNERKKENSQVKKQAADEAKMWEHRSQELKTQRQKDFQIGSAYNKDILNKKEKDEKNAAKSKAAIAKKRSAEEYAQEQRVLVFKKNMNAQYMQEHGEKEKQKLDSIKKAEKQRLVEVATAAKKGVIDMTQFNRTMFTTAAFVGFFTRAFKGFANSIKEAADLDRVSKEYDRVFGDSGALTGTIKGFTTTAVDRMEAMRSAIALGQLGIAKNSGQAAELIGMAATAAKMAGKDTSEGISKVTEALKTGSFGALEFLNEIRGADPALKAYLETLNRAGGALGGAMTAQAKYNLILSILRKSTQGHMKDERDLVDVVTEATQSFGFLRMGIGRLLGSALGPLVDKLSSAMDNMSQFIDRIRMGDKTFPSFIRNILLTATSLAGLLATTGTLRLTLKALTSFGIGGIPALAAGFLILGQLFGQADGSAASLAETFKSFGSVAAGVFQLVQSFIMDPENYAKGIGKMDRSLHDFLAKKGLLNLATNMARVTAVIVNFSLQVGKSLANFYENYIQPVVEGLGKIFGLGGSKPMSRQVLGDTGKAGPIHGALVGTAAVGIASIFGAALLKQFVKHIPIVGKLFAATTRSVSQPLTSVVSRIPLVGGLLSRMLGGKGAPKGSAEDPLYVVTDSKLTDVAKIPGIGSLIERLGAMRLGVAGTTLAFGALAVVIESLIALEKTDIDAAKAKKDKADDWTSATDRISGAFPGGIIPDTSMQSFRMRGAAGARAIATAKVPDPLSGETMNDLERDIKEMSTAERSGLVDAITASQGEKAEAKSVLDDPIAFADIIEKAINKSRAVPKKKASHPVKSGRC